MKLLFLTPQLPYPPRQGTTLRNYHLLAHLARRHTVDLLTFLAPGEALTPDNPLHALCRRIAALPQPTRTTAARLRALLATPLPDMALRLESPAMHTQVRAWLADGDYDVVQVEGIELAQYMHPVDRSRTAVVFDDHNCEYLLQQRNAFADLRRPRRWHAGLYSLVQWAKLRRYEAAACRAADAVVAVSAPDLAALQRIAPTANLVLAPNGIDPDGYQPPSAASPAPGGDFTLLFTGKMDYRPNIDAMLWFCQEVLPHIQAVAPHVHCRIVGMNPSPRLDPLRRLSNVTITGAVADIRPDLHAARAYIIPMRVGGGTRFKALEAMAAGKAIVSTTLGVEGIGVQHERDLLIGDTPADFAAQVLHLVADQAATAEITTRLGRAAQEFVCAHYTWERIVPILDQVYTSLHPRPHVDHRHAPRRQEGIHP
jgi:sugar transferase (PEP-CTERM/EpsH1 system associated)